MNANDAIQKITTIEDDLLKIIKALDDLHATVDGVNTDHYLDEIHKRVAGLFKFTDLAKRAAKEDERLQEEEE